ncbi:MAG: endonuclease/exonuclease/phosphatase family protein [Clostridia bacterium]|nr:endonuclease/exonuclease/phosphatase family protein [Clostridia bacterium]
MKRIVSAVLILVLLLCTAGCGGQSADESATKPTTAPAPPSVDEPPLKIVSFNIQTHSNGNIFSIREEMMKEFITETQPDSIGMQEVTQTWRKSLEETCFGEDYSSVGNSDKKTGEMNAIFYRNDKFAPVDSGTFWLSDTPDVAGSKFEESVEPRVCTWVRLKSKTSEWEFVHLNVHLENNGTKTSEEGRALRLKQGRVLLDFVKTLGDVPVVVTGDFNQMQSGSDGVDHLLYQQFTGRAFYEAEDGSMVSGPFADARITAPETVSPTEWASMTQYHLAGERYNPARGPIDYIFYTPSSLEPTVYRNILYVWDEIFTISDHLPQYAEFTVK